VTDQPARTGRELGPDAARLPDADHRGRQSCGVGETLKSFLTELRLDKVLASARPGDVAMIQFGITTRSPVAADLCRRRDDLSAYLRTYIAELRRRG
jgi:hypothetical protein